MKRFKKLDIALQVLFLILYVVALVVGHWIIQIASTLACLYWQLISMFVHHARHWFIERHLFRARFDNSILLLILITLVSFIVQLLSPLVLCIILIVASCGYLLISIAEFHVLLKRPLSYLK